MLIEDIGPVAEQGDRDDELWVINNVTVGGIPYFDMYKSCLHQCLASLGQNESILRGVAYQIGSECCTCTVVRVWHSVPLLLRLVTGYINNVPEFKWGLTAPF